MLPPVSTSGVGNYTSSMGQANHSGVAWNSVNGSSTNHGIHSTSFNRSSVSPIKPGKGTFGSVLGTNQASSMMYRALNSQTNAEEHPILGINSRNSQIQTPNFREQPPNGLIIRGGPAKSSAPLIDRKRDSKNKSSALLRSTKTKIATNSLEFMVGSSEENVEVSKSTEFSGIPLTPSKGRSSEREKQNHSQLQTTLKMAQVLAQKKSTTGNSSTLEPHGSGQQNNMVRTSLSKKSHQREPSTTSDSHKSNAPLNLNGASNPQNVQPQLQKNWF